MHKNFGLGLYTKIGEYVKPFVTVQELIDELQQIENKTLPVVAYVIDEDHEKEYDICPIIFVDTTILDRVDLNIILEH